MNKNIFKVFEFSLLGAVIFFIVFRVVYIFTNFLGYDIFVIIIGAIISGVITGYEIKNKNFNIFELMLLSFLSIFLASVINLIFYTIDELNTI